MKKKQKIYAIIGVVVLIAAIGIGTFLIRGNKQKNALTPGDSQDVQATKMKPEDIGLTLTPNASNQEVAMKISDVSKFNSFEYEMNYDAIVDGESVPRGAIGSGEVKPGESSIERKITIGTCSSGTCKYDKGVTKINFIIRLNLKNGTTGVVEQSLTLE